MTTKTNMNKIILVLALNVLAACTCNPECKAGDNGCPCKEANVCNEGLVCTDAKCTGGTTSPFVISDAKARGCELVITEAAGTTVSSVSFKKDVKGTFIREAPRTAVSFVAPTDATIPAGGVEVILSGPTSGATVSKVSCVDSAGTKIDGVTISLR